ncbi:MBL fold metallo-hydrolase [Antrihabitans spumae]|uniref:MBL fold metallo-hydrolase n=1 Tax=Antrihabitans spumae TaxID=3373370 RepID=A0ABW7K9W1_9NOCA
MNVKGVTTSVLGLVGLGWIARTAAEIPTAMGASVSAIRPYATGAANFRNGTFHNTEPSVALSTSDPTPLVKGMLARGKVGKPSKPVPLATPLAPAEAAELALTWYGHASALVEIDGYRILADPVWGQRVSPSSKVGPARLHPVPVALESIPRVDAIVISHDHYDHLDLPTVKGLLRHQNAPFIVPLGIGAHLRQWQVPEDRIVELDWNQSTSVGDLTITCTEARHFSGRGLVRNTTLWASWTIQGPTRRAFFGGDSGYGKCYAEIGKSHGPFDLTILPIGAYNDMWRDIHMNPEEAVQAHADLNQGDAKHGVLIPIHWATFNLAFHAWSEPVTRLLAAVADTGTAAAVPMPGQRVDVLRPSSQQQWWEGLD